jgi:hypothetical protein
MVNAPGSDYQRALVPAVRTRKNVMQPFFTFEVNLESLTDAMWAFVTDPHPSRNERPVVQALHDIHPDSVEVLEAMLLDGTEERGDVADYVTAVFGQRSAPLR